MGKRRWRDVALLAAGIGLGALTMRMYGGGGADAPKRAPGPVAEAEPEPEPEVEPAREPAPGVKPRPAAIAKAPQPPSVLPEPSASKEPESRPPAAEAERAEEMHADAERLPDEEPSAAAKRESEEVIALLSASAISVETRWTGPVPERDFVELTTLTAADPYCRKLASPEALVPEDYVVSDGELAGVLVVIEDPHVLYHKTPVAPVVLDQRDCRFTPSVLALEVEQPLLIRNLDPTLHNVNAHAMFNQAMPKQGQNVEHRFHRAEAVPISCDVHKFMSALVYVVDHPYFAVTDRSGRVTLRGLPAGDYTLLAQHRHAGLQRKHIHFDGRALAEIFTFSAPKTAGEPLTRSD